MDRKSASLIVIALGLAVSACSKNRMEYLPPAPGGEQVEQGADQSSTRAGSQADFLQQMAGQDTIYFDTDSYSIDTLDTQALQSQARWLAQYPGKTARIEGHADERGTREYNIALGERRANAAKNYLLSLGVSPSRLTVVSYGKERPVALGSDESSWAQNRRTVTITID